MSKRKRTSRWRQIRWHTRAIELFQEQFICFYVAFISVLWFVSSSLRFWDEGWGCFDSCLRQEHEQVRTKFLLSRSFPIFFLFSILFSFPAMSSLLASSLFGYPRVVVESTVTDCNMKRLSGMSSKLCKWSSKFVILLAALFCRFLVGNSLGGFWVMEVLL